jgi:hypothetical protein
MSSSSIFTSVIITLIILGIFLLILVLTFRRNPEFIYGTVFRIQDGVTAGAADSFNTGSYDLYIGNSTSNITLTILSSPNNIVGREIIVRNNTNNQITLREGDGVTITKSAGLTNKINTIATLIVVGSPNTFQRIA